jgi:uncharacterized membrane protein
MLAAHSGGPRASPACRAFAYGAAEADKARMVADAPAGRIRLTHIMYALHAFSAVTGVATSVFVVAAFVTTWPSIIAVVLNYATRGDVRGTFLESHYRWQVRTFWWAVLWYVIAWLLFVTILFIPFAFILLVATGVWVLYRIARGWLALNDDKPIDV